MDEVSPSDGRRAREDAAAVDTVRALAPYDNGSRQIVDGATLVPIMATPAAEAHLVAWTKTQALKAAHEAGHTCVAALLQPPYGPVATYTVSIKNQWSGTTAFAVGEDTEPVFETASQKRGRMVIDLAGLEAERALFAEPTDGSASDIESAATLAAGLISAGLHAEAALVTWSPFGYNVSPPRWLVDDRYRLVEKELQWAHDQARTIVGNHKEQILAFAKILFEARRMEAEAIDRALAAVGIPVVERKP